MGALHAAGFEPATLERTVTYTTGETTPLTMDKVAQMTRRGTMRQGRSLPDKLSSAKALEIALTYTSGETSVVQRFADD